MPRTAKRSHRASSFVLFATIAAASALAPTPTRAQVFGPYWPNPIFGFGGGYAWGLPPVSFGTFSYPALNFGVVDFGVMNWYPADYWGWYNPYWYFEAAAQADFLATADASLSEATFNVQSMQANTVGTANSMIGDRFAELAQLDNMGRANHSDRFNVQTGARWSTGRASGVRLVDLTSNEGQVLWPLGLPNEGYLRNKRTAANESISAAIREFRTSGKTSVEKVSKALHDLSDYATPAVDVMRRENASGVHSFIDFVRNLDQGLRGLVGDVNVQNVAHPKLESPRTPRPPRPSTEGR
jgi:hypothetical protein